MAKFDSFSRDINKLITLENEIQDLMKEKKALYDKKKSTNKIDYMLKGRVDTFRVELEKLQSTVSFAVMEPMKYNISQKEADKRNQKVEDFVEKLKIIESQIQLSFDPNGQNVINSSSVSQDLEENLLGDDSEYMNTRGKNNKQVLDVQKDMLRKQDDQFDQISGIAHNMAQDGRMIGEELEHQNNMLDDLNRGMDKTNMKMMRVDSKLKKLIAESSQ